MDQPTPTPTHIRAGPTIGIPSKAAISRHWDLGGYTSRGNRESAVDLALEVELPSITDFRYLFPPSDIVIERLAGLPKSLIATR
jgi:hypothetical protein